MSLDGGINPDMRVRVRGFDLETFLPHRLAAAQRALGVVLASTYEREFGLTAAEWKVMAFLSPGEPRAQREMLTGVALDKVSISRAAQSLLDKGLIEKIEARDRRSHLLRQSATGRRLSDRIEALAVATQTRLLAAWTPREVESCTAYLRRIEDAATGMLDHDRAPARA